MEINRNQYFMIGIVLLLLGLQFRMVDRFVLNQEVSQFLAERQMQAKQQENPWTASTTQFFTSVAPQSRRTIEPPDWLGFSLLSVGAVLVLHSLAMKRPEG